MTKKKENKIDLSHLEGHRLKTRRDFLASGLVSMTTSLMAPSLLTFLTSKKLYAQDCGASMEMMNIAQKTPILIFDFAGGANFAGSSVMVGGAGGQTDYLASYAGLGLPPDMHPSRAGMVSNELGLQFHGDSPHLRGIRSVTSAEVRSRVDGGIFCARSADDTGNNPHNPMYWLNKAGAMGELTQLIGTRNGDSGGNSMAPIASLNPTIAPVTINTPRDALSLVSIGKLNQLFPGDKAEQVMRVIERMSEQKLRGFSQQNLSEQIRALVKCGYINSRDMIGQFSADNLDAALDNDVTSIFNLSNADQRRTATIAKLVLDGYAGTGTIVKGGYDYHTGNRRVGEVRDFDAGALIGQVLQLASLKRKNVMIYVITDGSVSSRPEIDDTVDGRGKYNWTGDSSVRSSAFMLLYRHAGRVQMRSPNRRQIGHFRPDGSVDQSSSLISNNVTNLVKAVVANYLALDGQESRLAEVVGDNPFGAQLENYLFFPRLT